MCRELLGGAMNEHTLLDCLDRLYYTTISDKEFKRKDAYERLKNYLQARQVLDLELKENIKERGNDEEQNDN